MRSKGRSREVTIRGTVLATERDEDDAVTGLLIEADDGESYLVEPNSASERMLEYVDEEVKARGIVRMHEGQLYMNVRFFVPTYEMDGEDEIYSEYGT